MMNFDKRKTIGVLGGGQLGRMMVESSNKFGYEFVALDGKGDQSPMGLVCNNSIKGSFQDKDNIKKLSKMCDIVTVEIEHVNCDGLFEIVKEGATVYPQPDIIKTIQDKYNQKIAIKKMFENTNKIVVGDFKKVEKFEDAINIGNEYGYPYMLKSRVHAYDGRGNAVVNSKDDTKEAWDSLKGDNGMLYAERWVPYKKELSVMVARGLVPNEKGEVHAVYPVSETVQKESICFTTLTPARISNELSKKSCNLAVEIINQFKGVGIFGIEMFLTEKDEILINEIAPRPHNTGHYTMEACVTDQFEQHIRAISGLPLGDTKLKVGAAMMVNVLGDKTSSHDITYKPILDSFNIKGAGIHFYCKGEIRPKRKLAHITITDDNYNNLFNKIKLIDETLLEPYNINLNSNNNNPEIGIIMGSDSDLPTMKAASDILDELKVPYELTIVSAHRTPDRMYKYAQEAESRGIKVIIAGAGGAAHLPGMVAALTPLPVIGVPVKTSTLNGLDSLLSIVQMPRGVPVATVAIGNAKNAGLLAVRMLGIKNSNYLKKISDYQISQKEIVEEKALKIENDFKHV